MRASQRRSSSSLLSDSVGSIIRAPWTGHDTVGESWSTTSIFAKKVNMIMRLESLHHVVSIQDGNLSCSLQILAHHFNVAPRYRKNWCRAEWSSWAASVRLLAANTFDINDWVRWQKWRQMFLDTNWTHAWTATTMGNAKCFVQIQMGNIGANITWSAKADLLSY